MRTWFTMTKIEDDETDAGAKPQHAEIVIYDAIGKSFWDDDAVSAKNFIDALGGLGDVDSITLRINSPGGDVFDGVAIYNAIKNHKANVVAQIDGIAASAASLIAMAANRIVMPSNAFMLVHRSAGFSMGNADDMRAIADDLDRIDKAITATYVARTGQAAAKVKALMKEDRLMDAAEARELGYADEVTPPMKMSAKFSLRLLPKAAAERFRAETGEGQGDPPLPVSEPQKPVEQPEAPPASPNPPQPAPQPQPAMAAPAAIPAVAAAALADDARAYITAITDLCTLAAAPERVGAYLKAGKSVDQVRKELLDMRASAADVLPQHPMATQSGATAKASAWEKITDRINARAKK